MMSEIKPGNSEEPTELWDRLLAKYVAVWLWSIIFGASTGLGTGFLLMSYQKIGFGPLFPIMFALALLGVCFAVGAWFYLYLFLTRVLLPQMYGNPDRTYGFGGRYLARAFLCTFSATLIGVSMLLLKFVFEAL